jgi:hypothetical protein
LGRNKGKFWLLPSRLRFCGVALSDHNINTEIYDSSTSISPIVLYNPAPNYSRFHSTACAMRPMRLDSLPPLSPLSHRINSWFDGLPSPASTRTTAASPAVLRPIENVQSTVPIKRAPEQSPRIGVDQENQILLPNKRSFDIAMDQRGVARDESPSKRPRYEDPETPTAPRRE